MMSSNLDGWKYNTIQIRMSHYIPIPTALFLTISTDTGPRIRDESSVKYFLDTACIKKVRIRILFALEDQVHLEVVQ